MASVFTVSSLQIAKESARGSLILFAGNSVSSILLATAGIIIARLLGPDGFGVYTLAFVVPSTLTLFSGFGITTAVSRYAANYISTGDIARAREVTRRGVVLSLGLGAILSMVNYVVGPYLAVEFLGRATLAPYVQLSSLYVIAIAAAQASTSAFIGWGSMGKVGLFAVLQAGIKFAMSPALVFLGFGAFGAIVGNIASYVLQGAIATLAIIAFELSASSKTTVRFTADARMMVGYGLPVFAGGIISGVASQYLTIILASVATNVIVGYYQAAMNVTATFSVVSSAASTVLLRSFASLEGIKADLSQAFDYAVRYVSLLLTPIVFFLVATAGILFVVLYGPFYSAGTILLALASASYLPVASGLIILPSLLNGMGQTKLTLVLYIIWTAAAVISGPVFAVWLHMGAEGIIFAILLSNLAMAGFGFVLSSRYAAVRVNARPLGGIVAAAIAGVGAMQLIPSGALQPPTLTVVLDLIVFAAVYLSTVPLFRGIGPEDVQRLRLATEHIPIIGPMVGWILQYENWIMLKTGRRVRSGLVANPASRDMEMSSLGQNTSERPRDDGGLRMTGHGFMRTSYNLSSLFRIQSTKQQREDELPQRLSTFNRSN